MSSREQVPQFVLKIIKIFIIVKYEGLDTHTHCFKENKIVSHYTNIF